MHTADVPLYAKACNLGLSAKGQGTDDVVGVGSVINSIVKFHSYVIGWYWFTSAHTHQHTHTRNTFITSCSNNLRIGMIYILELIFWS